MVMYKVDMAKISSNLGHLQSWYGGGIQNEFKARSYTKLIWGGFKISLIQGHIQSWYEGGSKLFQIKVMYKNDIRGVQN